MTKQWIILRLWGYKCESFNTVARNCNQKYPSVEVGATPEFISSRLNKMCLYFKRIPVLLICETGRTDKKIFGYLSIGATKTFSA